MSLERRTPRWPTKRNLRTCALVFYGLLCLAFTLPGGSRMQSRAVWRSEHTQRQFREWAETLSQLGVAVNGKELERELWSFTSSYAAFRRDLLAPLYWLPVQLGFGQSWRMFSSPQTTPSQLWVEIETGGNFEPVYISRSSEFEWRRHFFEHHRVRKLLGRVARGGKDQAFAALSKWVAARVFLDFPAAGQARLRTYTWTTPPPPGPAPGVANAGQRPGGEFTHELVFTRPQAEAATRP